ncbi:uncharacterized protein TNCV_1116771 [Trichonephila clavipes]|nr:uncharacterized protein TNCV_1116771 [Trichonephila clavipes]
MEVTRVKQHAYIKITVLRGGNAMECHSELVEALGNNALPYRTIARCVGKFQQGHVSSSDEQRSRRPELIRYRWFSTRMHIANAVRQQVTRFKHDAANAETDYIKHLPRLWQRVVTVAGDYIEGL